MELATSRPTTIRPEAVDIVRTLNLNHVRTIPLEDRMALSASKLRANVYRLLDQVLETGKPLEIERNGRTLVILPKDGKEKGSKLGNLPQRPGAIIGDPDELIHMDWSSEWNPDPY